MYQHFRSVAILALLSIGGCRDAVAPSETGGPSMSNKPPPGPQQPPPRPSVLAFSRFLGDSNAEIYRMYANGTGITRLTFHPAYDTGPAWSPDGKKLAFLRIANVGQIYLMNADGSGKINLSNSTTHDWQPVWSPDGTKILFSRQVNVGLWGTREEVYVMNADGSGQASVSKYLWADDWNGRWSPSGDQVVFVSERDGNREVYRVNVDGTGAVNLTQNALDDDWPDWSPDGQKIAFGRGGKVYAMNADGSAQAELNPAIQGAWWPRWSPSGSALLVIQNDGLMVLNADGSDLHNALNKEIVDDVSWSPDGSRIAFFTLDVGGNGLGTVGPDGSNPTMITNSNNDREPAWRP